MNSLDDLNNFSRTIITFTDDRPFSVTATTDGLPTTSVDLRADLGVDFSNYGLTITKIIAADDTTSDHITLTFDFSAASSPTVTWPTAPTNVVFSEPTPGVYVASKIQLLSDYNYILDNVEIKPVLQTAAFSYTVSASWPGTTHTQTFNATMLALGATNDLAGRAFTYTSMAQQLLFTVAPIPTVSDLSGSTITMDLTISTAGNMLLRESETTGSFASSVTISGTESQLNTAIQQLWIDPYGQDLAQTLSFSYDLQTGGGSIETGTFTISTPDSVEFTNFSTVRSFTENTTQPDLFDILTSLVDVPSIVDNVGQNLKLVLTATNITSLPAVVMQPSRLIAPGASYPYATSIDYTGSASAINSWLSGQQIGFIPESGEFADHTVNWEIQNPITSAVLHSGSFTVAGTARTTALTSEGTFTYNWNGVDPYFELDITEEMRLYCKADILLAGGGGAGGQASGATSASAGGDGGSGGVAYAQDAYLFSVTDAQVPSGYGTENSPQFRIYVGRGGYTTSNRGEVGGDSSVFYYANGVWSNRLIAGIGGGGGGGGFNTSTHAGGSGAYGGGGGGVINGVTLQLGNGGGHILQPTSSYLGNFFGTNLIKERYTNDIYIRTEGGGTGPGFGFSDQGRAGTGPTWATRGPDATIETYGVTDYPGPGRYDGTWSGYTPGYDSDITGSTVTYGANGGGYSQGTADGNRSAVSPTAGGNGTVIIKVKAA